MKFTPLKFQGTLAAAGVALMPYVFLKINIFKSEEEITLSQLSLLSSSPLEHATALLLTAVMGIFIIIHFSLTAIFIKELFVWIIKTNGFKETIESPLSNQAIFSPLISLPMTMIVFFGPVSFFVPKLTANIQSLILPAFILFSLLWAILISIEIKVAKIILATPVEYEKLNFGWLLDVLALGAVSLLGASIVLVSKNNLVASSAAAMTAITLLVGIVALAIKITILIYQQIKSKVMPGINLLPAYFLVVPPMCLLGFGLYKLLMYASKTYAFDANTFSILVLVFSYLTAISWFIFSAILLREYINKKFLSSEFSPAQWGIV